MSTNTVKVLFTLFLVILVILVATGRIYVGKYAAGVAWDWGGVEIIGDPGFFICPGVFTNNTYWHNPLSDYFPYIVSDC